jgi:glycosyltransferase involved in cell wall biosynthesis
MREHKIALFGTIFLVIAFIFFVIEVIGFLLCFPRMNNFPHLQVLNIVNILFITGMLFFLLDFILSAILPFRKKSLIFSPVSNLKVSVGMTAYNDELAIAGTVKDFLDNENVSHIVVVDNNSTDKTTEEALKSGVEVVKEAVQGYGACCMRALREAARHGDIICLVEGDGTFCSSDLKKLMSYIENADMVIGTRTTKELNTPDSQVNFLIRWGNVFMAKLLQIRFLSIRLTDLGCTYRLIRRDALEKIIDKLKVTGNHFSCEMIVEALKNNLMVIEIPVTFRKRVGESKGVGNNIFRALVVAARMWYLIVTR